MVHKGRNSDCRIPKIVYTKKPIVLEHLVFLVGVFKLKLALSQIRKLDDRFENHELHHRHFRQGTYDNRRHVKSNQFHPASWTGARTVERFAA